MESRYQPEAIESLWHKKWNENQSFSPSGKGKAYSIVIPPPNVTGALHLGHALNNTVQDILVRWQRKLGKNTLWIPGTDHAGIATQAVVEKRLKEKENKPVTTLVAKPSFKKYGIGKTNTKSASPIN